MKRIGSFLLILAMVCSIFSAMSFPASAGAYFGEGNCVWSLDGTVLTISGEGDMENFGMADGPWGTEITQVIIEPGVTSIRGFSNCVSLSSVTIPDTVEYVGYRAFMNCSSLEQVILPNGILDIGEEAFANCTALAAITIPASVEFIYNSAFSGCVALNTINLSGGDISIRPDVFENTGYYNNPDNWQNDVLYIGDYLMKAKQTLSGAYSVKAGTKVINESAFEGCESLTSVSVPDSVVSIGAYAFAECSALLSANVSGSVSNIEEFAFSGCSKLTSFSIPNGLKGIPSNLFENCTELTSVTIPSGVEAIGYGAFENCSKLTNVVLPYGITYIDGSAFYGCAGLTEIDIPETVTYIGDNAFYGCAGLTEIDIPGTVTEIGTYAFGDCTALSSISFPDSVTELHRYAFYNTAFYNDYENWAEEESGNVLYLGNCLIEGHVDGHYTVKSGVKCIGGGAFEDYGYYSLVSVTIPDSVVSIGSEAFYSCESLETVTIGNGVVSIGSEAFYSCESLETVTIGNGVEVIGSNAFANCENLETVSMGNGVEVIGSYAFANCDHLKTVTMGNGVKRIEYSAFSRCINLESINIPDSVVEIGSSAFSSCSSLKTVVLSKSISTIEWGLFEGCENLGSIRIPDGVTTIDDRAFSGCTNLMDITIPDSVTYIGYDAFENTGYYNDESNWENDVLYIGDYLIKAKETISGHYDVKPGTKGIATHAFCGCENLTSVTIPGSVETVAAYAYEYCSNLKSVVLREGIKTIECFAFGADEKLQSVTLPESITTIEESAFAWCDIKDVYYAGSEEQRALLEIGDDNLSLMMKATWHYNHTAVCGHTYDNACAANCNLCGEPRVIGSHIYTNACDADCNICGVPRPVAHQYANACDTACDICGAVREISHTYANACDTTCDVCGATREITHSFGEYVYNNDATMEADGTRTRVCTICGHSETVTAPGTLIVLSNPFTDVKANVYYEKPVLWAVNKGITNGMGNGQFKPNETCTRGQIVTFLWRAQGCPEPQSAVNPFSDVAANAYYTKAVLWAVEQGITNGTGAGKFSPDTECTREQIITFLWRSQGKPVMGSANPFSDVATGTYYHNAVLWAVDKGITKGTSATTFAPKDDCTRGQIVTFLYRCLV